MNALEAIYRRSLPGVHCIAINSPQVPNRKTPVSIKLLVPDASEALILDALQEERERILTDVRDAEVVLLIAGLGGVIGSFVSCVLADMLAAQQTPVWAIVTQPFTFEGRQRRERADKAIALLSKRVDMLITRDNQALIAAVNSWESLGEIFMLADESLVDLIAMLPSHLTKPASLHEHLPKGATIAFREGQSHLGR